MSTVDGLPIVAAAGGSFLLEDRTPASIFTPEDLNEEQRQFAATAAQFARDEILAAADDIEAKKPGAMAAAIRKAGELGFTADRDSRGVRRHGAGQGQLHRGHRSPFSSGEFFNRVRRTDRHRDAAAGVVRNRDAEEEVSAEAGDGRVDQRLRAFRIDLGFGCHEHSHPRDALGGRHDTIC